MQRPTYNIQLLPALPKEQSAPSPTRVGSLVSSTSAEPLTTVSNTAKMYAYFSFNEKEFLALVKGLEGKNLQEKFAKLPDVFARFGRQLGL